MAEILTESFCERCGIALHVRNRAVAASPARGVKVLSRGLKNFVLDDKTSLDEAMAAARSDTDRELTSQQLDAFHETFNFCMSCRQYTCPNCWNEAEGHCLTCAPRISATVLRRPSFPASPRRRGMTMASPPRGVPTHGLVIMDAGLVVMKNGSC